MIGDVPTAGPALRPPSLQLSRRRFVQGAVAGTLLWASPQRGLARSRAAGRPAPFTQPLPRLSELTAADIDLTAAETLVQLLPGGPATRMWTFNGTFPGPLIRRPSGQRTTVTLHNQLPVAAGTLTLHHHGGHQESIHDGQPATNLVDVGSSRTYVYDLIEDGVGERGALQWYHDHSHQRTGRNSWMGLVGMFLVDDGLDAQLGLPTGDQDIALLLTDRAFDEANQLLDPFATRSGAGDGTPPGDEVVGDVFLMNGASQPFLDVQPRRYRFRLLNASNFRVYNLALEDGTPLVQVGNESGLLTEPVTRDAILLGPAERAEFIVDFHGRTGALNLISVPLASAGEVPRTAPARADLLQFRVAAGSVADTTVIPAALRPLPSWVDTLSHTPDRVWVFGLGVDPSGTTAWTVNGRTFDHERVDARPELGSTETWLFVNTGPVAISHYIHLHDVDWHLLSRNLAEPEPWESGLKETFRLDPGEVLLVGTRFTDHLGRFMVHCHMLEHEDHGMMTTFEVVEPGKGDRLPRSPIDPTPTLVRASMPPATAQDALAVLDHVARTGAAAPFSVLRRPLPALSTPIICTLDPR